jgi:hypothetical protein
MAVNKNFVVKNGLEVNTKLILADSSLGKVGIGTTFPKYFFHVEGDLGATNAKVTGITTVNNFSISGTFSPSGVGVGSTGRVLVSTAIGCTWAPPRTSNVFTATSGQTTFSVSYIVGLVDVYVNGVRLVPPPSGLSEFSASNSTTVVLNTACFGGEVVEIVTYSK